MEKNTTLRIDQFIQLQRRNTKMYKNASGLGVCSPQWYYKYFLIIQSINQSIPVAPSGMHRASMNSRHHIRSCANSSRSFQHSSPTSRLVVLNQGPDAQSLKGPFRRLRSLRSPKVDAESWKLPFDGTIGLSVKGCYLHWRLFSQSVGLFYIFSSIITAKHL